MFISAISQYNFSFMQLSFPSFLRASIINSLKYIRQCSLYMHALKSVVRIGESVAKTYLRILFRMLLGPVAFYSKAQWIAYLTSLYIISSYSTSQEQLTFSISNRSTSSGVRKKISFRAYTFSYSSFTRVLLAFSRASILVIYLVYQF